MMLVPIALEAIQIYLMTTKYNLTKDSKDKIKTFENWVSSLFYFMYMWIYNGIHQ